MDSEKLIREINEEIKSGFQEIDQSWRDRATIHSCDFLGTRDELMVAQEEDLKYSRMKTYAKMFSITPERIENCEWRELAHRLGRGAAIKFKEVFTTESNGGRADVYFLNGMEQPIAVMCQLENGVIEVREYFDFGVVRNQCVES